MNNLTIPTLAGAVSGILCFVAFIPYILAILRRETTPNRATWFIWTVVATISLLTYNELGAGNSIWYPLSDALTPLIVLILAIKYGEDGWSRLDQTCLIIAALSVLLWWVSGSALMGLCLNLVADAMGAIPTIKKAYSRPNSENKTSWTIASIALVINMFSIQDWKSFSMLVYPIYMLFAMGTITLFLWVRPTERNSVKFHNRV